MKHASIASTLFGAALLLLTGEALADAGPQPCAGSGECAAPTPYCSVALGVCVECLSNQNCSESTGLCNTEVGVCSSCASHSDCYGATPYCSPTLGGCVECVTNANCGTSGLQCRDGACGWCGDAICGPRETLYESYGYYPPYPYPPYPYPPYPYPPYPSSTACPADCLSTCPGLDLGSAVGASVASGTTRGAPDRLASYCGGAGGPDLSFAWTAPAGGVFSFDTVGSDFYGLLSVLDGDCTGVERACSDLCCPSEARVTLTLAQGERLVLVVDSADSAGGSFVLNITAGASSGGVLCDALSCPASPYGPSCCTAWGECGYGSNLYCEPAPYPPPGTGGSPGSGGTPGFPGPEEQQRCRDDAAARGEALCPALLDCGCAYCPREIDDCSLIPGCREVEACMVTTGCVGVGCYDPQTCAQTIEENGGVSGPAFRASVAVRECATVFGCALPCPGAEVPRDAGTDAGSGGASSTGRDAGLACTPGEERSCACPGGLTGTQVCDSGGELYRACDCAAEAGSGGTDGGLATAPSPNNGCGCRLARLESSGATASLGFLGALWFMRRARRRRRQ